MKHTVTEVWQQYKHGSDGQPAIEALELQYDTNWRNGTKLECKFGSNYKAVRKIVADKVEQMSLDLNIGVDEVCRLLDERYTRKIVALIKTIKAGEDPLKAPRLA